MSRATPNRGSLGSLESAQVGPFAVMTSMVGHISHQLPHDSVHAFRAALAGCKGTPTWIIDCSSLNGFDPAAVNAGAKWFEAFKATEGRDILLVAKLHSARMVASTIAFGVGLRVRSFDELKDALDHLGLRP
jgi:hypothetical protein